MSARSIKRFIVLMSAVVAIHGNAALADHHESGKMLASDGDVGDHFGTWVSSSGDRLLVGASYDDDNGEDSGAAYVYERSGSSWNEWKLLPIDGNAGDVFGYRTAIHGDVAIVGAVRDSDLAQDAGSAYVFRWNGSAWIEEAKLVPSDSSLGDFFGSSVAIQGSIAVVGSRLNDELAPGAGAVYVFQKSGSFWLQQAKLTAPDGAAGEDFGWAVAISGLRIVVGARFDDDLGTHSGSAHVFRRSGGEWVHDAKLLPSAGGVNTQYGTCAIDGDVIVVGAVGDESAYVYRLDPDTTSWNEEALLTASDGDPDHKFGWSVAVDGDDIAVGAHGHDGPATNAGCVYLFRRECGGWTEGARMTASSPGDGDSLGASVVFGGGSIFASAPNDDEKNEDAGAVYEFLLDPCPMDLDDDNAVGFTDLLKLLAAWGDCGDYRVRTESEKLLAYDGDGTDFFGHATAFDDGCLIVGASADDDQGFGAGAAYVYRIDGDVCFEQKITVDDGDAYDSFGWSVAITGALAVIGASGDDDQGFAAGAAYVFRRDGETWVQTAKLLAADGASGAIFGDAVAVNDDGTVIVVGAFDDDDIGAAYVFRWNGATWAQEAKLVHPTGAAGDSFGLAVDVSGDTIVVGAPYDDAAAMLDGSAHVFRWNGTMWVYEQLMLLPDPAGFLFGRSVAVLGDRMCIASVGGARVFVYEWSDAESSWIEQAQLVAGELTVSFGISIDLTDDVMLVGDSGNNGAADGAGAAYLYRKIGPTWTGTAKLIASDAGVQDWLGTDVAIAGDTVLAGAYLADASGVDSGAVYRFPLEHCPEDYDGDGVVGFTDLLILLASWGSCP